MTVRPYPAAIALWLLSTGLAVVANDTPDFNRDIRPILSDKCFHCHGPDANNQKSEFRLDSAEHAIADLGGYAGIVPGDLEASELAHRISSNDSTEKMPPPDSNRSLSEREKSLLRQWISSGAQYDQHWAFKRPVKAKLPEDVSIHPIDYFVRKRLKQEDLSPSPRAGKRQLIRRVTLDLTGLPPTPEEVEDFINDHSSDAYSKVVDRLLASPAYGEKLARVWLDASRYADSAGYQNDFKRSQWPWRDWVVQAYNRNLPFDQFSIQQLAGDLLPEADGSTRLATAFNRNHRINNEGGIIPAEFLVEYVADRVETTSTVWLGLTAGCARCHDHKYDPISMRDFYQMFAFFHNIPEKGKDGAIAPTPNMDVYTGGSAEEHQDLLAQVKKLQRQKASYSKQHRPAFESWKTTEIEKLKSHPPMPKARGHYSFDFDTGKSLANLAAPKETGLISGRDRKVLANGSGKFGKAIEFKDAGHIKLGRPFGAGGYQADSPMTWSFFVNPQKASFGDVLSSLSSDKRKRGYRISLVETREPDHLAVRFQLYSDVTKNDGIELITEPVIKRGTKLFSHVSVSYDGSLTAEGVSIYINGQPSTAKVTRDKLSAPFASQEDHLLGAGLNFAVVDEVYIHRQVLPAKSIELLSQSDSSTVILSYRKPNPTETAYLERAYFDKRNPGFQSLLTDLKKAENALQAFERRSITEVSIMEEMDKPRETHLLLRGAYDQPDTSETLSPQTFASLPPMADNAPRNRLGLAQWLFQEDNPLTARVAVNRYWQIFFGSGLVKTPEDFGSQGSVPTHPELLDWLAVEFRDSGWDIKSILRQIVTSETYCQDSRSTPELNERDPNNDLFARGPRFRLSAFAIRDQALAAAGLLVNKQGGPPVMPYQPAGLWEEVSAKGFKYVVAKDEGLYRRSLYTFWRRTVPPPNMMNFDSAGREACAVNVSRTNTPLQAMNLLNDPQFVEAARGLAERMIKEGGSTPDSRFTRGTKLLWGRAPTSDEMKIFYAGYADYLAEFQNNPDGAKSLISVGHSTADPGLPIPELAAYMAVATILLNLDETVTKE